MDLGIDDRTWASELAAAAEFGDVRRSARVELMLRRAVSKPAGRLTDVFDKKAELQAAYDFVEGAVSPSKIIAMVASATCVRLSTCERSQCIFVVVDGTSLSLTDRTGRKGFGSIGMRGLPTRGLKVINALALSADGVPVGLLDMQWWARGKKSKKSRYFRRLQQLTETRHWIESIRSSAQRLRSEAPESSPCFVIDREGDNGEILRVVRNEQSRYIVRAAQDRPLVQPHGKSRLLRAHIKRERVVGVRVVEVPAGPHRRARIAELEVRVGQVVLDLPDRRDGGRMQFETNVVWAVERRAPRGEAKLDWLLLTNEPVASFDAATAVLDGYCLRWRVEDFHKAWKSGRCNVEQTQLRAKDHVIRWATLLAAVAVRVEQLKHLARTTPDEPATIVFTPIELEALKAAKMRQKKRTEVIPEGIPTIGQAVRWIGDLGGYNGASGIPGSLTLSRGLETFTAWAAGFAAAAAALQPKRRRK